MIGRLHSQERGSGTVVAVGIIAVLIILLGLVAVLGSVAAASNRATAAADLAALAAADTARGLNTGDPCTVAQEVTGRHEVRLEDCTVGGEFPTEVTVSVAVEVDVVVLSDLLPGEMTLRRSSRAGPPEALTGG